MTTSVAAGNCESSESDIVYDHIRLRQHQIVAITYIGVRVGALHMKYTGTIESGETVGGSPGGGELSSGGGSTKMIRAARTPIARSCSSASASTSCNRPITKLQDLLGGGRMRRRSAATHADAGAMKVMADRAPRNAQLRSDLAQGPAFRTQLRRTFNVHGVP